MSESAEVCPELIAKAAEALCRGDLVAFPTETVYGLGALALEARAVQKIFLAKGRPSDNPLIVHVPDVESARDLVESIPPLVEALMRRFSPGPLTYVLKKAEQVPQVTTAGLDTVAIRIPSHPLALAFLQACQKAVAAPSANLSGRPSPTRASDVEADLGDRVAYVLDGGPCQEGLESTVLDCSKEGYLRILRPGSVTIQDLIDFIYAEGLEKFLAADWEQVLQLPTRKLKIGETPESPGMKYRHYAPERPVQLLRGTSEEKVEQAQALAERRLAIWCSQTLGNLLAKVLSPDDHKLRLFSNAQEAARGLFGFLRDVDTEGVELICVEALEGDGIEQAYMNRAEKAAQVEKALAPNEVTKRSSVCFVCSGNTCRSPLAAYLFNYFAELGGHPWRANSAGLNAWPGDGMAHYSQRMLKERYGIDGTDHRSQTLTEKRLEEADLVLTMTQAQASGLRVSFPDFSEKIFSLKAYVRNDNQDVRDPFGGDLHVYEACADELEVLVSALLEIL